MWRQNNLSIFLVLPILRILLLSLSSVQGRFYIGEYKTVPVPNKDRDTPRSMPYILYDNEAANRIGHFDTRHKNRRVDRPIPQYHQKYAEDRLDIGPPTIFGPGSFYGNNQPNGYSVVSHEDINYVVPPFTPGGRVNVAFQFWIPISIGGFFVTNLNLQKALKSPNPTAYLSTLFLKNILANTTLSDMVEEINSPVLEKSIQTFLDWVIPNIGLFSGRGNNNIDATFFEENEVKSRRKRAAKREDNNKKEEGWVTIGGDKHSSEEERPTASLMNQGAVISPILSVQSNRVLWSDEPVLSHNNIQDIDRRPDPDFDTPNEGNRLFPSSPRPFSSRPHPTSGIISSARPTNSYVPPTRPTTVGSIYPLPSTGARPPYHLTSFDDLPSSAAGDQKGLDVTMRLSRLDYFFSNLHLDHEECRRRVLCEVAREPETYSPLSDVINGETRFQGDFRELSRQLLNTAEGARLLSYIEAVKLGEDTSKQCDVYRYRCRTQAREIINTDILPIWREVVRWLTVKVLTQDPNGI